MGHLSLEGPEWGVDWSTAVKTKVQEGGCIHASAGLPELGEREIREDKRSKCEDREIKAQERTAGGRRGGYPATASTPQVDSVCWNVSGRSLRNSSMLLRYLQLPGKLFLLPPALN